MSDLLNRSTKGEDMLMPAEIERFRTRLERERENVRAHISALRQGLALPEDASDTQGDQSDDATKLYSHEETLNEIERSQTLLTQVDKALQRIADGTYGFSEVSGQPIPLERLEALPYATTLVGEHLRP